MHTPIESSPYFTSNSLSGLEQVASNYFLDPNLVIEQDPHNDLIQLKKEIQSGNPWRKVIHGFASSKTNLLLERTILSPSRSMFFDLIDFSKVQTALDLGAGFGQLTLELAQQVAQVLSIEGTRQKMDIAYAICQQEKIHNVNFVNSNFFNLEIASGSIDLAILYGINEWVFNNRFQQEISVIQAELLAKLNRVLSSTGQLVIAMENRVAMKYLLGEKDGYTDSKNICYLPFEEADALFREETKAELPLRTYDIAEFEKLLAEAGFEKVKSYLAFPDYKLPHLLIPVDDQRVVDQVIKYIGTPLECDDKQGYVLESAPMLDQIYRSVGGLNLLKNLAPSFVILAEK